MFKKNILKIILITIGVFGGLFIIAKLTGVLQYAFLPTGGSEPTIKRKSFIFFSNALPYKKFKILVYNQKNTNYQLGQYPQRLVATEGDILQISEGKLIINNENVDHLFTLKKSYKIDRTFVNYLVEKGHRFDEFYALDNMYFLAQLADNELTNDFAYELFAIPEYDAGIRKQYGKKWTANNFGPIKIPKGKLFFLGDNRNESLDSRYLGFVDKNEVIGRVFIPKN